VTGSHRYTVDTRRAGRQGSPDFSSRYRLHKSRSSTARSGLKQATLHDVGLGWGRPTRLPRTRPHEAVVIENGPHPSGRVGAVAATSER
jgi:hypothetical protein